jgi:tetratricopeptide (TPR) repeat protein
MIPRNFRLALSCAILGVACHTSAQQVAGLDQQDMQRAEVFMNEGKYQEALDLYLRVPENYPTSPFIPGSNLGAAVCYFFLKDYDKAAEAATRNFTARNVPPEVLERSYVLVPQVLTTKAVELPADQETLRKKTFEDAIKSFDEFTQKFPQSPEVETALFGKGRAMAMIENFEGAAGTLKQAMDRFPRSPTLQDTKFLRGLVLAQQGIKATQNTGGDATSNAALDEAEKTFREIINARTDLALMNSSFVQLGDVLTIKASLAPRDSEQGTKLREQALELYRQVRSKEEIIAAQDARVKYFDRVRLDAGRAGKLEDFRTFGRTLEKEREKLETIKSQPDQSLTAKLRGAQIFVQLGKFDEARVLLGFINRFLDDMTEDEKKQALQLQTVTYAAQHVPDKAVAGYEKFKEQFKNDPAGENLALLVGGVFLDPDPKINDPDEAMKYFDEQVAAYPASKSSSAAIMQKATALMQLGRYDEAVKSLQSSLSTLRDPDLLAEAEFALAVVYREMQNYEQAIATFKSVREKYPNTAQAEQAAFWVGEMTIAQDAKAALTELNAFTSKYPDSALAHKAAYFKARAHSAAGDRAAAIRAYRDVIEKFPASETAQPSFFESATLLQREAEDAADGKKPDYAKVHALIQEFVQKYPESPQLFSASDFSAQLYVKEDKPDEGIRIYEEFIQANADNPDVARAHLSLANVHKTRAERLGTYLSMGEADKLKWTAGYDAATRNAEQGIEKFPESPVVAQLLDVLLQLDTMRMRVGLKKADDVKTYFTDLAARFEGKTTKPKILFALANFLADNDREKKGGWFEIMDAAYDPQLVFSPSDLDRYGNELINRKNFARAEEVFAKLAADYPLRPGQDPSKATRTIGEAQAVAMAGRARILQAQGKAAEGQKILEELKRFYPWSAKVAEADFGIAAGLYEQKKFAEAMEILKGVARNAPVKLRAQAMMMLGKIAEEEKYYDEAVNNYVKVSAMFESERELAAEGLWRGAQLLEQLGTGKLEKPKKRPVPPKKAPPGKATPAPTPTAGAKTAQN